MENGFLFFVRSNGGKMNFYAVRMMICYTNIKEEAKQLIKLADF